MGEAGSDIAFIGDADSVLGFEALGVRAVVPSSPDEAITGFRRLARSRNTRVIMVTEEYIDVLEEEIAAVAGSPLPAVVILPGITGSQGHGADVIRRLVTRAVGVDLMAGDSSE